MSGGDDLEIEPPDPSDDPELPADGAAVDNADYQRKKRRQESDELEGEKFWRAVLAAERGRREIWKLLADAHTFEQIFGVGPTGFPDPYATFRHAGEQAFGHRLYLKLLALDAPFVNAMLAENDDRLKPKPKRTRAKSG